MWYGFTIKWDNSLNWPGIAQEIIHDLQAVNLISFAMRHFFMSAFSKMNQMAILQASDNISKKNKDKHIAVLSPE